MCGEDTSRVTRPGEAIAIIRASPSISKYWPPGRLRFHLMHDSVAAIDKPTLVVVCEDWESHTSQESRLEKANVWEVHIHQHGDLTTYNPAAGAACPANPVLCSFDLDARAAPWGPITRGLHPQMTVTVGQSGIIGRMVSVVRGGETVGVGIVGWG